MFYTFRVYCSTVTQQYLLIYVSAPVHSLPVTLWISSLCQGSTDQML